MGDGFVFQIDGNLGAAAAMIEMLVQCEDDHIRLCLHCQMNFLRGKQKEPAAEWVGIVDGMEE